MLKFKKAKNSWASPNFYGSYIKKSVYLSLWTVSLLVYSEHLLLHGRTSSLQEILLESSSQSYFVPRASKYTFLAWHTLPCIFDTEGVSSLFFMLWEDKTSVITISNISRSKSKMIFTEDKLLSWAILWTATNSGNTDTSLVYL